jgi:hypothetical protein
LEREKCGNCLVFIETHAMREGGRGGEKFPHNGRRFRALPHTMETCFAAVFPWCGKVFHGVEKPAAGPAYRGGNG